MATTYGMFRPFRANLSALYQGDNGRLLCGRHLGAMASATGRDLSGQPLMRITTKDRAWAAEQGWFMCCETCTNNLD